MLRSKSQSCKHETPGCICSSAIELRRDNWRSPALSIVLLLMHAALLFKLASLYFPECSISLSACETNSTHTVSAPELMAEQASPSVQLQMEPSVEKDSDNSLATNRRLRAVKSFTAADPIENLYQNLFQHICSWMSEWLNGPVPSIAKLLATVFEIAILSPYIVLRGLHLFPAVGVNFSCFYYLCSAIDLVYGVTAGLVLFAGLRKLHDFHSSAKQSSRQITRYLVTAVLLICGPLLSRLAFQASDLVASAACSFWLKPDLPLGVGLFAALRSGPFAIYDEWFWCLRDIFVFSSLLAWLCLCSILILQLVYLLLLACAQSILFSLHLIAGPFFVACTASPEFERITSSYFSVWVDLILWMTAWAGLITSCRSFLYSELNPNLKVIFSMCVFQAMIFTPLLLSKFNLSPVSPYLAVNPVTAISRGVSQLASVSLRIFDSFHRTE